MFGVVLVSNVAPYDAASTRRHADVVGVISVHGP
jgi:hypothetical protein